MTEVVAHPIWVATVEVVMVMVAGVVTRVMV
jgi:hypothetical protein